MGRAGSGQVEEKHLYLLHEWKGLWQTGQWTSCLEGEVENQFQSIFAM